MRPTRNEEAANQLRGLIFAFADQGAARIMATATTKGQERKDQTDLRFGTMYQDRVRSADRLLE